MDKARAGLGWAIRRCARKAREKRGSGSMADLMPGGGKLTAQPSAPPKPPKPPKLKPPPFPNCALACASSAANVRDFIWVVNVKRAGEERKRTSSRITRSIW